MTDHNTCKTTTDRLEEAVLRLTQNQTTLTSNQQDLSMKIDSILEQLQSLSTITASSSTPPPQQPPQTPSPHLIDPISNLRLPTSMELTPWDGSSKSHSSSIIKEPLTRSASLWHPSTWMVMHLAGFSGCSATVHHVVALFTPSPRNQIHTLVL